MEETPQKQESDVEILMQEQEGHYIDLSFTSSSVDTDTPSGFKKHPRGRTIRVSIGTHSPLSVDFLSFSQFSDDKILRQFANLGISIGG
jgi:hypothetical protein